MRWMTGLRGSREAQMPSVISKPLDSAEVDHKGMGSELCSTMLNDIRTNNQIVKNLIAGIEASGCNSLKKGLQCDSCVRQGSHKNTVAYYHADLQKVTLCANRVTEKSNLEENIIHELIHAYDSCKQKDFFMQCKLRACSEIRASRLGECRTHWDRANCVRQSALASTKIYCPNSESIVNEMMETCYKDISPLTKEQASKKWNY